MALMRKVVLFAIVAFLVPLDAHALLFRAYLASDGNDANPCTLPQPCRLLPAALSAVSSGGEIWMVDSANYNTATVNIDKSVSILAVPGVVGSIVAIAGPAISITTNDAVISLRNVVIAPLQGGGGTDGIYINATATVSIENSVLAGLPSIGVNANGAGKLVVMDSLVRNCGAAMYIQDGFLAQIANSRVIENGDGVIVKTNTAATTKATIENTVISGGYTGVHAWTTVAGGQSAVSLSRCTIHRAAYAIAAETAVGAGPATALVGSSQVNASGQPWWIGGAGATVRSYGNNQMFDNGAPTGPLTPTTTQ